LKYQLAGWGTKQKQKGESRPNNHHLGDVTRDTMGRGRGEKKNHRGPKSLFGHEGRGSNQLLRRNVGSPKQCIGGVGERQDRKDTGSPSHVGRGQRSETQKKNSRQLERGRVFMNKKKQKLTALELNDGSSEMGGGGGKLDVVGNPSQPTIKGRPRHVQSRRDEKRSVLPHAGEVK